MHTFLTHHMLDILHAHIYTDTHSVRVREGKAASEFNETHLSSPSEGKSKKAVTSPYMHMQSWNTCKPPVRNTELQTHT